MEITTKELDEAVAEMVRHKVDYTAKKKISNEADANHKKAQMKVLELLTKSDKDRYSLKDVGDVSVVNKLRVTVPKTPEDKAALFKFIKDNLGVEGYLTYVSVNSNSLNSLYNTMREDSTNPADFSMAGVGNPTLQQEVRFIKRS